MSLRVNLVSQHSNYISGQNNTVPFKALPVSKDAEQKNKKLPAILLTVAAIGIGVFAFFKLRKSDKVFKDSFQKGIDEAQIQLKNIFEKDFGVEETKSFVQKYQELSKISDNKEYYQKLFEQLKKDFSVENKNLALELWEKPLPVEGGVMNGYTEALTRKIGATAFEERLTTFMNLFHEFRHVKQNELMYKTDSQRLIQAKVTELEKSNNASWQEILKNCGGDKNKARKMVQEEIERVYKDIWGHLKPAPKTSTDYTRGIKYLENEENRIPPGEHYYEQIQEKEAQFVEKAAEKLFKILESIGK